SAIGQAAVDTHGFAADRALRLGHEIQFKGDVESLFCGVGNHEDPWLEASHAVVTDDDGDFSGGEFDQCAGREDAYRLHELVDQRRVELRAALCKHRFHRFKGR